MILEGIVTTKNAEGVFHIAPMGPIVDDSLTTLTLRPFKTSQTYRNLKEHPYGVFHVVDDVLLLAQAAIGRLPQQPEMLPAEKIDGSVLKSACRWYEFEIETFEDFEERTNLSARIVHSGRLRDFFGLSRAKHAVVEAAILATRLHLIPQDEILDRLSDLKVLVEKTGGSREAEAFDLLERFVADSEGKA